MLRPTIIILGKLPPPYYGPAIATEILLKSKLNEKFRVVHHSTNLNEDIRDIGAVSLGKLRLIFSGYIGFVFKILIHRPRLLLIPISQSTPGFIKDSIYILLGKLLGRKVILHLRGSNFRNWLGKCSKIVQKYVGFNLKISNAVIVLGNNLRYLFADYFKADRVYVIPNGANYNFSKTLKRNKIFKVLYLSNLQPSKGIEDVVTAAEILNNSLGKKFLLEVVGAWRDSTVEQKCLNLCNKKELPVKFFSPADAERKKEFLENADLFVFPPRAPEGHPWVIVEALAAGLPIIATDQGAIIESVLDGENGYIVQPNNPKEIAQKIEYLILHPEIREKMAQTSYQHYINNFTEETMVKKLSSCFDQVLAR